MDLRSLPLPLRLGLAVAVPALALLTLVAVEIGEQAGRAESASEELARIDALQALTNVQKLNVLPELAALRLQIDRSNAGSPFTDLVIDGVWDQFVAEYTAADDTRSALDEGAARVIAAEASAALEAQRRAMGDLVSAIGNGQPLTDELISRAADARDEADLAVAGVAVDAGSNFGFTHVGVVDAGRSVAVEYAYVSATLAGLEVAGEDTLAELGGARSNATAQATMGLGPDRQRQIQAELAYEESARWDEAVADARAVADGRGEPWSVVDVTLLNEPAFARQTVIVTITDDVVDGIRSELSETRTAAVGQRRTLLLVTGLLLIATTGLTALVVRSVQSPIRRLSRRALDLAEGRLDQPRIDHGQQDSLAELGNTIEDVADGLRHLGQQFEAMADGDLDDPSLSTAAPGAVGQFVQDWLREIEEAGAARTAGAAVDELTGLLNRQGLGEHLGRLAGGPEIGVVYIDLDRFKAVNDGHGHRHGDAVLKVVARRLLGFVREDDPVCRLEGDEFVLLVSGVAREDMPIFVSRLELGLSEPISFEGTVHQVGCSIGVGWLEPGDLLEPILEEADRRMLSAKADRSDHIPR